MPPYEIGIVIRNGLNRPELKEVVKRVCGYIHNEGGIIQSMENLGEKPLPMIARKDNKKFEFGNYIFLNVNLPSKEKSILADLHKADLDVLRFTLMGISEEPPRPCLYKPCVFGEVVKPSYDRSVYKVNTLRRLKNRHVQK